MNSRASLLATGDLSEIWCGWRDLNPHDLRHQNLNLACLPIPPHPRKAVGPEKLGAFYNTCGLKITSDLTLDDIFSKT